MCDLHSSTWKNIFPEEYVDMYKTEKSFPSNLLAEAVLFLLEIFSTFQQNKKKENKDNMCIYIIPIIESTNNNNMQGISLIFPISKEVRSLKVMKSPVPFL